MNMIKASMGREIVIKTLNDIGVIAEVTKCLSERGISILAISAWVEGPHGIMHLVTNDNLRAMDCLHSKFQPRESAVITVEVAHRPGMLRSITELLREQGVDIHHLYASAYPDQDKCLVVFSSSYNDRALLALR